MPFQQRYVKLSAAPHPADSGQLTFLVDGLSPGGSQRVLGRDFQPHAVELLHLCCVGSGWNAMR